MRAAKTGETKGGLNGPHCPCYDGHMGNPLEVPRELLEYLSHITGETCDQLLNDASSPSPSFVGQEYLDDELIGIWPSMPAAARLVLRLLAYTKCDHAAQLCD